MSILETEKSIRPCRKKWKGIMTDRQRFNAQMNYQSYDRCFNMEFGYWDENFFSWDIFVENGVTSNEQAEVFFQFDRIDEYRQFPRLSPINPPFSSGVISETERTKIIMDGDGVKREVPTTGHDAFPRFLGPSIVKPDDWKKCKEERFRRDDPARIVDIEELKHRFPATRNYPVGVFCGTMIGKVRDMLTFEGLAYSIFDYPEMVEDMVETFCVLQEDLLDQVLPHIEFDFASGWEDICFNSGPIVTVPFFRDVVLPRYKRLNEKLNRVGIKIWYTDCDGDVRPLLPYFLEAGINCLFPYEVHSCAHPSEVLNEYGRELRMMGGVNKMVLAEGPESIKSYLASIEPLVARGGYIPFCDHRCPPNVKPEYYLYYLDLKEQMFGLQ